MDLGRLVRSNSIDGTRRRRTVSRRAVLGGLGGGILMTLGGSGTASLFSARPKGGSFDVRYRQGVIVEWNPATLENIIEVSGEPLVNLPVLGVAEAASYVPGITVGLHLMDPGEGRAQTWAIVGRFVAPGTTDATDAITQLGSSIQTDFVAAQETTTSVPFADLATVGPTVSVTVGASGKLLIFASGTLFTSPPAGTVWGVFMNVQLTGANTVAPSSIPGGLGFQYGGVGGVGGPNIEASITRLIPLSGLNPGPTIVQAKYAVGPGNPGETARFRNRSVTVFAT